MNTIDIVNLAIAGISLDDLAEEVGLPKQTLKQYRLAKGATGQRNPPAAVQLALVQAVAKLAKRRAKHFAQVAAKADFLAKVMPR